MNDTDTHARLQTIAVQEAALAAQEQTADTARQRNELLREIQKILKEINVSAFDCADILASTLTF